MNPALWIFLLVAVGLALILLEVFVPSGGVLGLLSVVALGAGVITTFIEHGPLAGVAVLTSVFVAVPVVLMAAFRWFPLTPLGRRVLPQPPDADDVMPDAANRARLRGLVGRFGRVTSELLPWGTIEIDGGRIDAVSDGGPIALGTAVEAVGVQARAVVVRAVGPQPEAVDAQPPEPAAHPEPAGEPPGEATGPRLSNVLEEFDFDEFRGKDGG
jgi:membrane-bound ClpP family serine protease